VAVAEPVVAEPVVAEPVVAEPVVAEPVVAVQAVTEPVPPEHETIAVELEDLAGLPALAANPDDDVPDDQMTLF
jgi:hypothetical protein